MELQKVKRKSLNLVGANTPVPYEFGFESEHPAVSMPFSLKVCGQQFVGSLGDRCISQAPAGQGDAGPGSLPFREQALQRLTHDRRLGAAPLRRQPFERGLEIVGEVEGRLLHHPKVPYVVPYLVECWPITGRSR